MNSFGTATLQFGLVDPQSVRYDRARFRRESLPLLERVNSFYCPIGCYASRGWVLLPRYEYNQLDSYATTLQLNLGSGGSDNLKTLKNLAIVQAQCVTRGLASDPNALYLIELTDSRGIVHNKWFQSPANSKYNIRAPAYPQVFHPASLNSGAPWTWNTMLQNLWEQMSPLGSWPGLPSVPAGVPEGFWFLGVGAWQSLCKILDYLGLTVACDLTQDSPYTIVSTGGDDAKFIALQAKYAPNLEDDLEWLDLGAGRVPKQVVVLFRRRNSVYGTEETVRYDSPQWDMDSVYSVTIAAPTLFASAAGTHHIWSDFTVRYDQEGVPLPEDTAIATAIATERTSQYFDRIYSRNSGYMTQTYAGALPFSTGSQVDGVKWAMDYRTDSYSGWRTQIVRASPPWPHLWT